MAMQKSSAQQKTEQGLIAYLLTKLVSLLVFLAVTLVISILVEWGGIATVWRDQGLNHSETMLSQELQYLNQDFRRSALVAAPAVYAQRFADTFYDWSFKKTRLEAGVLWLAQPLPDQEETWFRKKFRPLLKGVITGLLAAMTVTQVFAVRLAVLTLAMPAFVLLALVGLVDGLIQRDIRRWSGGRETSFVYHWAKKAVMPSLIIPWILYLAMPTSIHPNLVVLPFAAVFALSVTIMAYTFKKYL